MRWILLWLIASAFVGCAPVPEECRAWAGEHAVPAQLDLWTGVRSRGGFQGEETHVARSARRELEAACLAGDCWPVSKCEGGTLSQVAELKRLTSLSR